MRFTSGAFWTAFWIVISNVAYGLMWRSVLCLRRFPSGQSLISTIGVHKRRTTQSLQAGPTHQKTIKNGANSCTNGLATVSKGTDVPRWVCGIGRFGMSRTLATGKEHPKNSSNCMTTPLRACGGRYLQHESGAL